MTTTRFLSLTAVLVLFATAAAHAQGGCADSPEAPTDVLMLVGSVGMVHGSLMLKKFVASLRNRR